MRWLQYVVICFLLLSIALAATEKKKSCIQPIRALHVKSSVPEPSGLSYSANTGHIYLNCDHCPYLTEFDYMGLFVRYLNFDKNIKDVEAVAVDDKLERIYIASEGKRIVTYFALDDYSFMNKMKQKGQFHVETKGTTSSRSGIEGMTVLANSNLLVANEKQPKLLVNVTNTGQVVSTVAPHYSGDLSGLAYDAALDLLWVLSDQSEAVYLTDLTGMHVLDRWDLPVKNPEGIAINNDHDPPLLYVTTDPSAPAGPQYAPLLLIFVKPEQGSGLEYHKKVQPSPLTTPCVGCGHVCKVLEKKSHKCELEVDPEDSYEGENVWEHDTLELVMMITAGVVVSVAGCCCVSLILAVVVFAGVRRWRRKKAVPEGYESSVEMDMVDQFDDSAPNTVGELEDSDVYALDSNPEL